jgi:hypothetical protein
MFTMLVVVVAVAVAVGEQHFSLLHVAPSGSDAQPNS